MTQTHIHIRTHTPYTWRVPHLCGETTFDLVFTVNVYNPRHQHRSEIKEHARARGVEDGFGVGGRRRRVVTMVVLPDVSAASSATVNTFTRAESQSTSAHSWESRVLALAMAAHSRLGIHCAQSVCDVARSPDLLLQIMRQAVLVVPDDVSTLVAALHRAAPWQQVLLRRGEYNVDGRVGGGPGSSQLRVSRPVEICGEPGAVLRGTLVLDKHCLGGAVRNLRIDDGGDCCIRCEGGSWELTGVRLRCSHGSALLVTGSSRVVLSECVLGGEDDEEAGQHVMLSAYGSLQETGLHKRACFALVSKDEARIVAKLCSLRQCSEAAVPCRPRVSRVPGGMRPLTLHGRLSGRGGLRPLTAAGRVHLNVDGTQDLGRCGPSSGL
jgi:hypothetical protein